MGQFLKTGSCPTCGKQMTMALPPGGKGPRILRCVECDPLREEKVKGWLAGDVGRNWDPTET
jgi:hypothetical protein